jgi:hypothetical protein
MDAGLADRQGQAIRRMLGRSPALIVAALLAGAPAAAAERAATVRQETFACTSWAGWREYVQASLTPRGARAGPDCPLRIPAKAKVTLVDGDAGAGAAEVRWRGRTWFVDSQRLD